MPPLRRLARPLALAAVVALGTFVACDRAKPRRVAARSLQTIESGGDVSASWNPQGVTDVAGIDSASLHSAIGARVAAGAPAGIDADHWAHVTRIYRHYGNAPLWLDGDGLIANRVQAMTDALLAADSDALDVSHYPFADVAQALRDVRAGAGRVSAEQLANADVLLTGAYASLGEDMLVGQTSPKAAKQSWHIDPSDEAIDVQLVYGLANDRLDSAIAAMRPASPSYDGLRKELARYRRLAANGAWATVPAGKALKPGERDAPARIEALRARLTAEGYADGAPDSTAAPGVYDRGLAGAVAQFQAAHAIGVDSILGAGTIASLNLPVTYRLAQIAANLERLRWMPRDLGDRYVLVNVPAFTLEAHDSGQTVLEMRVVVGQDYEGKTTPAFADSMETVVFRPYWNVTDDIAAQEIWPKVQSNPGYLESQNMETYRDGNETRIRQRPGDKNSLGYVKFLFPNDFNIYLHDTPARALFDKDVRAFSHGCIRVQKPDELAQWALGWDAERVTEAMREGPDNRSVKLPAKIPVFITYLTAYTDADGRLRFGNDLYDRDDALVSAMQASVPSAAVQQAVETLRSLATGG